MGIDRQSTPVQITNMVPMFLFQSVHPRLKVSEKSVDPKPGII